MAEKASTTKKYQRVRKRFYNQYLRESDPLAHAPPSSKKLLLTIPTKESDIQCSEKAECDADLQPEFENVSIENRLSYSDDQSASNSGHLLYAENTNDENDTDKAVEEFQMEHDVWYECNHDLGEFNLNDNLESDPESDYEDTEKSNIKDDQKQIYNGSYLTLGSSILLIVTFALKYSLTGEGICNLLQLINLHCPTDCILPQTSQQLWKWFKDIKNPLKFHNYCNNCHMLLNEFDEQKGICPNEVCKKDITSDHAKSHFIEIPIAEQIKHLFSRPSFIEDIKLRFSRIKKSDSSIEDIYDGQIYKSLSHADGILNDPHNLSLLWNTDGIPCFKSSNMSLWPLYFQVNELPYHKRINPDNMIMGGLWFGSTKPTIMSYTEPFLHSLKNVETNGVDIKLPDGTQFTSKIIVIGGTADLPARSLICNSMQFNGKFGCCKCLQPGETCKTSARGHVHTFPFNYECPDGPPRTHQQILKDSVVAVDTNQNSNGIKGPTFLQCLAYHNMVSGVCIDYMHGVLLGVTKLLLKLWFSSEYNGQLFSFYNSVHLVDKRLKHIKPPNTITRVPRSINDHLKYWKASELRSWLLYYSLPVLKDILDGDYYQHYLLFVNAVFILLQDSISQADIQKSDAQFKHFCCMFAALYGNRYMTCNIHQLLHLPQMVIDMGPLWSYSCFSFENANGILLKLYHGTQHVDSQIANAVCVMQCLPNMVLKYLLQGTPEMELFRKMKGISTRNDKKLSEKIYIVGSTGKIKLQVNHLNIITQYLGHPSPSFLTFGRVKIDGEVFHSRMYRRSYARNSYTIAYQKQNESKEFGQVEFYMQLYPHCNKLGHIASKCGCTAVNVAIVSKLMKFRDLSHVKLANDPVTNADVKDIVPLMPCVRNENLQVVELENIIHKCVYIEVNDKPNVVYACKMPNSCERD